MAHGRLDHPGLFGLSRQEVVLDADVFQFLGQGIRRRSVATVIGGEADARHPSPGDDRDKDDQGENTLMAVHRNLPE
jgi:hypothetical protein